MLTYKKAILLKYLGVYIVLSLTLLSCNDKEQNKNIVNVNALKDTTFNYISYKPNLTDKIISRSEYLNKLEGFWLGQCIANWTGLVTEMDKIGNVGEIKTGEFYTRNDWGKADQPSIWGQGLPSNYLQQ